MTQATEWLQNNATIRDAKTAHAFRICIHLVSSSGVSHDSHPSKSTSTMWVAFGHRHRSKNLPSFAVARNCGIRSSFFNRDVNAFDRLRALPFLSNCHGCVVAIEGDSLLQ
jgi:hypothetical protein